MDVPGVREGVVNEVQREWYWHSWYPIPDRVKKGKVYWRLKLALAAPEEILWHDWPDNVVEEDGDSFIIHDPPTNGLADKYNVEPYRYRSANPGNGWNRWTVEQSYPWQWDDGRQIPRRVVNALAGYRDQAVIVEEPCRSISGI